MTTVAKFIPEHAFPALLLAAVLCLASGPGNADKVYVDTPAYTDVVRESFYVTVRDGTRLAMTTYRPAVAGQAVAKPLPVVFAFTPYRARYRDDDGNVVETGRSERLGLRDLPAHGYVVAVADVRGKGASFGHRRGFLDRTEAMDGHDLVQWLAQQPWSDGRVGMTGCSYLGGTTFLVATTVPPALKAVFIGATDFDKYTFVRRGGITAQFNTRPDEPPSWDLQSLPVDDDPDGRLLARAVEQHAGNTPMAGLWYGMPYRDSVSAYTGNRFWEEVAVYNYLDVLRESGIAFQLWSNWSDEPTEQLIKAAANLPSRLLIGPGSHCRPSPEIDFAGKLRRFFDFHLKDIDNGLDEEPPYLWRLQNVPAENGWIESDKLPGDGIPYTALYLSPADGGTLESSAGESGDPVGFEVKYDMGDAEYFAFWPEARDAFGLTFTGPALEEPAALVGFPVVDLTVSIDREDANVFAFVEDVAPDGQVQVVAFGRLAASHRALAEPPYDNLGLPYHSGLSTDVEPMTPGIPARLRFSLLPNAWVFAAGHRVRLVITGADLRQRNLEAIRQDPPPRITVHTDTESASRVELPLVSPDAVE